ncbi:tetratricopeptide repeat protein [Sphingomonas sp. ID1715]|uniref:toll/interleukin-1 receptor domain-containing protein n=1 Tax=Sphingomonas sp. ID1715 TaxID=1656898 RepID=UPI001487E836|nr:toll/interleukin-1 receptor domain-containing protein [Sphingomonas sp. ID1715]NNM76322.1 tetratricopeptide repeat protein [Sphingomonas sp. ID1715]
MSRYSAFISYSHADQASARWLHQALETFRMPKQLVGTPSEFGPVPKKLPPVFRDREELPASGDLGEHLRAALADSRFQIVLCSPRAAKSKWVNEEILTFKRLHGEHRTLALILSGEPYAGGDTECFPEALRFHLAPDGSLSDTPAEPIAADIRPGKDGKRLALLKLIAGMSDVRLDGLVRRDAARRQRRMMFITGASLAIMVVTIGLAIYAEGQRRIAVRQQQLADRSLEFLIGTFAIANPATDNPRTITALTILNRASRRAADEFREEPAISSRLLRATGEIYFNLGLPKEAEKDLRAALAQTEGMSEERGHILLKLAAVAYKRGDLKAARSAIDEAARSYPKNASYAPGLDAEVIEQRGMTEVLAGRYAESARLLGEAATRYAQLDGDHRNDLGRVWMSQGQSLVRLKRFAEAERLFAKAEQSFSAAYGRNHVLTANAFQNQALADFESGDAARAAQRIAQAVAIYDRVLEGDHPTVAAALILQGRIKTAQGMTAGALTAFDRARAIYRRLYGPRNAAVGDADFYAAEAEAKAGKVDAALARLARTKSIYDENYGAIDPDQAELMMVRARILAAAGRRAEAGENCRAGLSILVKLDPSDPSLPKTRAGCAALAAPS